MCAGVSSARSRRTARCSGVGRHKRYTSRTGSGISIHRSGLTCCMMSAIGKRTARKSGVTGSLVPGWSTGAAGTGMSALMLYQALGSRDSSRRNLCWVMPLKIHAGASVRERENPGGASVLDDGHGVLKVGRQRAILGDHRPLVVEGADAGPPNVYHRLDRDRHAGDEPWPPLRLAIVRDLGLLVEARADPVPHEFPHDGVPCSFRHFLLDGRAQGRGVVVEPLEGGPGAGMAADELLGATVELLGRHAGADVPRNEGEGGGHNAPRGGHRLDLARRLDGDHRPMMRLMSVAMSSIVPVAGTRCTLPRCA